MKIKNEMIKQVSADFFVSNRQLQVSDITAIIAHGIRAIICNRPDQEEERQPDFQKIKEEAEKNGLETYYLPVKTIQTSDIDKFSQKFATLPKPILGYCRTGTRSTTLWGLSQKAQGVPVKDVLANASNAGYDIEHITNS